MAPHCPVSDLVVQNLHFKALNALYLKLNLSGKYLRSVFQIPLLMNASSKPLISQRKMLWCNRAVDAALYKEEV